MCGIFGIFSPDGAPSPSSQLLQKMGDTIVHRGPDDWGYAINEKASAGIGMRRLSIIDLSHGHQPLFNEDESLALVCNGEIYNYRELRRTLREKGHCFKTESDAEVILHLYEEYGDGCVQHLEGMFAFALLHRKEERLLIVRDRLGIKPLYYARDGNSVLFGSEIKALLAVTEAEHKSRLSAEGAYHFFSLNYVPEDFTLFEGVRKLLPGHFMKLERGREPVIEEYWDVPLLPEAEKKPLPINEYADLLYLRMKDAVESHLVSDVPVGIALSGGIDSSTIAHIVAGDLKKELGSFSIGFQAKGFSEADAAKEYAGKLGIAHHARIVEPDIEALFAELIKAAEDPCADSSLVPTWHLAKMSREKVTVLLSGDGGDEIFGGYLTYGASHLHRFFSKIPSFLRNTLLKPAVDLLPVTSQKVGFEYMAKRFVEGLDFPTYAAHYFWNGTFTEAEKEQLFTARFLSSLPEGCSTPSLFQKHFNKKEGVDFFDRLMYVDIKTIMVNDYLVKVDRMSMAHSLEVRVPFLDHRLVEFAFSVPALYKTGRGLGRKRVLKEAVRGRVPDEILNRPKRGFSIPVNSWLREELRPLLLSLLSPERLEKMGIFHVNYVQGLIEAHLNKKKNIGFHLWGLMVFSAWHREYLE